MVGGMGSDSPLSGSKKNSGAEALGGSSGTGGAGAKSRRGPLAPGVMVSRASQGRSTGSSTSSVKVKARKVPWPRASSGEASRNWG